MQCILHILFPLTSSLLSKCIHRQDVMETNTKVGGNDYLVHGGELRGKVEGIRQGKLEFHLSLDSWAWIIMSYSVWDGQNTEEKLRTCAPSWMSAKGRAVVTISQRLPRPKAIVPLQSGCQAKKGEMGWGRKSSLHWHIDEHHFQSPLHSNLCHSFLIFSVL